VLETVNGFAWAGLAYLLLMISLAGAASAFLLVGAAALLLVASVVCLVGWLARIRAE
jgi:hypothetical protein